MIRVRCGEYGRVTLGGTAAGRCGASVGGRVTTAYFILEAAVHQEEDMVPTIFRGRIVCAGPAFDHGQYAGSGGNGALMV